MRYLVAVIFPPAAVLLCGRFRAALLNIFLTLCLWVPGVIHAVAIVKASERNQSVRAVTGRMQQRRLNSIIRKA